MARKRPLFSTAIQSLLIAGTLLLSGSGFTVESRLEAAATAYQAGQYQEAIAQLEPLISELAGQPEQQIIARLNLASAYLAIAHPTAAQPHIHRIESLLHPNTPPRLRAAFYEVRGQVQFSLGHYAQALTDWETAEQMFSPLRQPQNTQRTRLHQVQALEALGQYRAAMERIIPLYQQVQVAPPSPFKAQVYRQLAALGQGVGEFDQRLNLVSIPIEARKDDQRINYLWQALQLLNEAIALTEPFNAPQLQADIRLELGNLERASFAWARDAHDRVPSLSTGPDQQAIYAQAALTHYQTAAQQNPALRTQAQMNQISLLVEVLQAAPSLPFPASHLRDLIAQTPHIAADLHTQPPSRDRFFQQLNLADQLLNYYDLTGQLPDHQEAIAHLLTDTLNSVNVPGSSSSICDTSTSQTTDALVAAYAFLYLGTLQEKQGQGSQAQACTEAAFWLAQPLHHKPLLYQVQWQMGRLLARSPHRRPEAIAAYENTLDILDQIRADLVSLNQSEFRFSFRNGVEPVYRELMALLLASDSAAAPKQAGNTESASSPDDLQRVTDVLAELQVATIEDYLRCNLQASDHQTAAELAQATESSNAVLIYPILTENRLEIILKHPQSGMLIRRSAGAMTEAELNRQITQLHWAIHRDRTPQNSPIFHQLYQQFIAPIAPELAKTGADTLIFGLDRFFQNIPMAALYDGEQYLVENYALAVNVGLPLYANSELPPPDRFNILLTGNSQAFKTGNIQLPFVAQELKQIQTLWPEQATVLQDEAFTLDALRENLRTEPFSIVHLATHGFFSSSPDKTYILTQDQQVDLTAIATLLQHRAASTPEAIQLLVLSACQTATGDRRAALGLAGMAVQTGARSAIASLRQVPDRSTANLMTELYTALKTPDITRAQALQQAQLALLQDPESGLVAPKHWSSFILIGNWQ
ncbi:CHAT domain-containing protein [Spirulina major]|uniref:CHAT domain-containing protein n=1 Tax=Spirulina major TaxID=270636 RepID=UPI000A04A596|nr:CHAT domain-containing protein [Spirulina major]